jgi:PleD family two-component response regulator
VIRSATARSRVSPAGWPRVSLTSLNLSRSRQSRAAPGAAIDVTEQRRAEARITHMAHHDALTGLPNRALFTTRLAAAITEHARTGAGAALLCLDLDKFKLVNGV